MRDEKGMGPGEGQSQGEAPGMGTAKRLLNIGMSNIQLEMVCHL